MPSLPYLSPYLRPLREPVGPSRTPTLLFDDGIRGCWESLTPGEERVVRALWDPARAADAWGQLLRDAGDAVFPAVRMLQRRGFLFPDAAACESHVKRILQQRVQDVPLVDQVELTNRCPMRCQFCPRGIPGRIQRPTGLMELALFERLLDQLRPDQRDYHPLELNNYGESLLHPQVDTFVAAAAARAIPTELSVNPALLTPELGQRLVEAGLRRLVVSLDGMDDQTLVAIRGPAARYSLAERNLDSFLEICARRPDPPQVVLQMIDLHRNRPQHAAFLARWGNLGLPFATAYIKDLDGPDPDGGTPGRRATRYLCTFPFSSVVVLWDGRVVPCCKDADAGAVLGSLEERSLADLWHGPAALELRRRYLSQDFPAGHPCHACPWQRGHFANAVAERHPDQAALNPMSW